MKESLNSLAAELNSIIGQNDEALFRKYWLNETYSRKISGPEGISGDAFFTEMTNKGCLIESDPDEIELSDDANSLLAGFFLKMPGQEDSDYIYLLIQNEGGSFVIKTGSDSKPELEELLYNSNKSFSTENYTAEPEEISAVSEEEQLQTFFEKLNKTVQSNSENNFAQLWAAKAFYHNLSGEGGISGQELYTQSKSGNWTFNPQTEYISHFENPDALIVPLSIWLTALEMEKPGDEAMFLIIKNNGQYRILGYGTDLSGLRHLYLKYKEGTI